MARLFGGMVGAAGLYGVLHTAAGHHNSIGLAPTRVHLVGIPIDATSVKPARGLGPALFVDGRRGTLR